LKFAGVGVVNTAVGYSAYVALIYAKFSYPLACLFSLIFGICFNYLTTSRLVFNRTSGSRFFQYLISYVVIYFFNLLMLWILIDLSGFSAYIAGLISLPFNAAITFWLLNAFVFRTNGELRNAD
jgi:putative flippase GtrA